MDDNASIAPKLDDDPVVQEIPIYLSKRLAKQLYVLQYPLDPKQKNATKNVRKVFFKPRNQQVKVEVGLDVSSSNFDTVRAEYIADEVESKRDKKDKKSEGKLFNHNIMDKVTYDSIKCVKEPSKYAVAAYNGKELHLTPLKGFLQLRPNFTYLDGMFKRKRTDDNAKEDSESEEMEAGPSSLEQITVKFARNEMEQMKKARENSFKNLQEKSAQEPWMECSWKPLKSTESEVLKHKLFAENLADIDQGKNIEPMDYLKILVPDDCEEELIRASMSGSTTASIPSTV